MVLHVHSMTNISVNLVTRCCFFSVWDVRFHPTYSNNLFSCSQDGSLWHWDASTSTASSSTALAAAPSSTPLALTRPHSLSSAAYSSTTAGVSSNTLLSRGTAGGLSRTPLFTSNSTSSLRPPTATNGPLLTGAHSTAMPTASEDSRGGLGSATSSPWLSGAIQQGKVEIVNLFPENRMSVNSLDIESRHLVCGTDGEALFVMPNLNLTWSLSFSF